MDAESSRSLDSMEGIALASVGDLRELFENAAVGVGLHAADGSSLWFNRTLRATLGYGVRECGGLSLEQLVEQEDVALLQGWIERCRRGQVEQFEVGVRMRTPAGVSVPSRVNVTALRDVDAKLRGFFYQVTDGRSSAETSAALSRELEFSRLARELATSFINTPDEKIDEAIVATLGRIGQFGGAARAGVWILDSDDSLLRLTHEWFAPTLEPLRPLVESIPVAFFPEWRGRLERGVETMEDVSTANRYSQEVAAWLQSLGICSYVFCPMAIEGRRRGGVVFIRARASRFSRQDRELTEIAAGLIGSLCTRRRRERQQSATERRFREMASAIDQVFWIFQLDPLRLIYGSPAQERIFGVSLDETFRDPRCIYRIIEAEDRAKLRSLFDLKSDQGLPREVEYRIRRSDGELRWLRTRVFGMDGPQGAHTLTGITKDVTSEIRSREAFERLASLDQLLRELATGFIDLPLLRIEKTLESALARLGRFLDVDEVYLLVLDAAGKTEEGFYWRARADSDLRARTARFSLNSFPWLRQRLAAGLTTWVRSSEEYPPEAVAERAACERAGVEFAVSAPVVVAGSLRGLLGINDRRVRVDWSEAMVAMLRTAADMFGSTLARRDTTRALAAEQQRNLRILDSAGEGIYGLDDEGRATFVNRSAASMLGWRPQELVGRRMHAVLHHHRAGGSEYPAGECPIYAAFRDGETHEVSDEVFWRRDGGSFPVEYVSSPIYQGGELGGAVVVFRDVTELRRAEESQTKLRRLLGVLNKIAAQFIVVSTEELDARLAHVLAALGQFAGADRVGLLRNLDVPGRVMLQQEWVAAGFGSLETPIELHF